MAATAVSSPPLPSSNTDRCRPSQFNLSSCSLHADHLRWRPRIHADGLVSSWKPATATSTSTTIRSDPSSDEIAPERKKNVIGSRRSAWSTAPGGVGEEGGGKVRRRVACRAVGRGEVGYNVVPERVKVAVMVALVMCLCNADRVVMSVAVVPLAVRYGWSSSFLGIVQSSFMWGYLVSSLVAGGLADRYGGKRVMGFGVAAWSLATFLTPWAAAHSTPMLLLFRVLFGLAEGVAIPSMNVILARWFPSHELATAVGLSMAGFHMGNLVSFLATPVVMSTAAGVAGPFALFAALGFAWLSAWAVRVASDPGDCPLISGAELQLIRAGKKDQCCSADGSGEPPPLRYLLSKVPCWAILFANFTNNWGYYVLLSWMAVYFRTVFGVDLKQAAWFSAVPWGLMGLSGYVAGAASDMLIRSGRHPVTRVRKIMQSIGFFGPGVALLCLNFAQTPAAAVVLLTAALSLSSFSQAGFFLTVQDIAPKHVGFLHGISNAMGTLGAIISTTATGYFVQWLGSFQATLTITAVLYFSAAIFWNIFATAEQVFF